MRVDHVAVRIPATLDGSADLVLAGPTAAKDALNLCQQVGGNLVATSLCQLLHKAGNEFAVAIGQEVEHALEVGANKDVHRRRDGREERAVTVVNAGGQEVGKHVVLVARHDELGDGQTHALGVVAGQDIAKVAGGHTELNGVAGLDSAGAQQLRIGGKVVDDLRYQAADVDGVGARKHRAGSLQTLGKLLIGKDALDGALGVVKVAADAADGDVIALLRGHLQILHAADFALGIKDGDARARRVGKTGECGLAGVARRGGDDHDALGAAVLGGSAGHQTGEHLQGDVLEGARGAAKELHHIGLRGVSARRSVEFDERRNLFTRERAAVCLVDTRRNFFGRVIIQ